MPVACCSPECRHRKRSRRVPLDEKRLALWSRNFPWRDQSHKDVLCDMRFREQDILKYFKHEIRGEVVLTPRAYLRRSRTICRVLIRILSVGGETPLCEDVVDNSSGGAQPTLPGGADLSCGNADKATGARALSHGHSMRFASVSERESIELP
ncbi:hypothetical protein HPB47_022938 [Ixodes persulcatus]|uniref:Uncharacterized protein n=1 Tax=Ixodes persulcatus TaxID=34615 RepID=A0AC60Q947_IXOPE|nr:hypothetical protein HPB47_022938 [Ixodes persulcatus]